MKPEIPITSVSALDTISLPRHRWYFFKEAFSPEFVEFALQDSGCRSGDWVIDPFSGSGTVSLVASAHGMRAAALEVNPFMAFVGNTKLLQAKPSALKKDATLALGAIGNAPQSPLEGFSTFAPRQGASKWLFNSAVLRAFEGGWRQTNKMEPTTRDLLRLALIDAAMDNCNAVKDGKCLRYLSDWDVRAFDSDSFSVSFTQKVEQITADLDAAPIDAPAAPVRVADARSALSSYIQDPFKLCVTSPPYLNSFDYTDVYRPELFLGKFVDNMVGLRALRQRTVRSHVQAAWPDPSEDDFGAHFTESIASISERADTLWNARIPVMIKAYFEDMRAVLRGLKSRARPDASVWVVVSTSAYAGVEIPVDLIIADIASQMGWYLREVQTLRYLRRVPVQQWNQLAEAATEKRARSERDHDGPHLRESLIVLDAKPRRKCA